MPPLREYFAHEKEIGTLLSGREKYSVPAHQRNYEWGENQVTQFWTDCADIANKPDEKLFIGTIVINKEPDPDAPGRLSIIDGQQRLATATILACVLFRKAKLLKSQDVAIFLDAKEQLLGEPHPKTGILTPVLWLNLADRQEFSDMIGGFPAITIEKIRTVAKSKSTSGRTKFYRAYETLYDKLEEALAGKSKAEQGDLVIAYMAALEKTTVIEVTVTDDNAAYDLFETLNDRGLPLSLVDLLKNHLFRNAKSTINELKVAWQTFEAKFSTRSDIPSFVTFVWRATEGKVRRHELFRKIKGKYSGQAQCATFIALLQQFADKYARLDNPDAFEDWPENSKSQLYANHLATLGTRQWYPLAMAAMLKLPEGQVEKVLSGLVKFTVRYQVIGERQPTYLEEGFSDIALKVWNGTFTTWGEIRDDLKRIQQYPSDTEFETAFAAARPRPREIKYLLLQLESHLRKEDYDRKPLTVEHILPKEPNRREWDANFFKDPEYVDKYIGRLGNLVLLPRAENKNVRNEAFAKKKKVYAKSDQLLAREVAKFSTWKKKDMTVTWAHRLGKMALQIWSL